MTSIDSLIKQLGDCGLFQFLIVIVVHGAILSTRWAMTFMAYGNYNPGWTCNDTMDRSFNFSDIISNTSHLAVISEPIEFMDPNAMVAGSFCKVYGRCEHGVYNPESSTIVTEWDLECDNRWITSLMITIQEGGYIVGTLLTGVLDSKVGRRPMHLWGMAFNIVFTLITVVCFHWQMFIVTRFFIGLTCGVIDVTNLVYPLEFLTNKWRAVVTALPFSCVGRILLALCAMTLKDWRYLHLGAAALTLFLFLSSIWFPESIRWLVTKKETEKSEKVLDKIVRMNRPGNNSENTKTLHTILNEQSIQEGDIGNYSFLELFRHGLIKRTLIIMYAWTSVIISYTIVLFNIESLSGDFYINLILFSLISTLLLPFVPFMTNSLGRTTTSVCLLTLSSLCVLGILFLNLVFVDMDNHGMAVLILSLLFMVFIEGEWTIILLNCVELYPTPLRSLTCSYLGCIARIGGMVAPFLIPHDQTAQWYSNIIMVFVTMTSSILVYFLPETKGQHLDDYIRLED